MELLYHVKTKGRFDNNYIYSKKGNFIRAITRECLGPPIPPKESYQLGDYSVCIIKKSVRFYIKEIMVKSIDYYPAGSTFRYVKFIDDIFTWAIGENLQSYDFKTDTFYNGDAHRIFGQVYTDIYTKIYINGFKIIDNLAYGFNRYTRAFEIREIINEKLENYLRYSKNFAGSHEVDITDEGLIVLSSCETAYIYTNPTLVLPPK